MDDDIRQAQLTKFSELSSIGLNRGAVARLQDTRGTRLHVETGSIWVTHERCADDAVVQAGETYDTERDGTTVVTSLGRRFALVTIESPAPTKPKASFIERLGNLWCSLYVEPMPTPRDYL